MPRQGLGGARVDSRSGQTADEGDPQAVQVQHPPLVVLAVQSRVGQVPRHSAVRGEQGPREHPVAGSGPEAVGADTGGLVGQSGGEVAAERELGHALGLRHGGPDGHGCALGVHVSPREARELAPAQARAGGEGVEEGAAFPHPAELGLHLLREAGAGTLAQALLQRTPAGSVEECVELVVGEGAPNTTPVRGLVAHG